MDKIIVRYSGTIRQPIDVVSRQFGDMTHHARNAVHPEIKFVILSERGSECRFTQEVRLLGMKQKDEIVQVRRADGSLESEVVDGTNHGMKIFQSFRAEGPNATTIDFRIEAPATGVKKWFKPFFEMAVRRTIAKAFDQDRADLEERGYPRRVSAAA